MKYQVVLTPEAQDGILQSFKYIHERAPLNAARWIQGLYDCVATLEQFPERCPLAPEAIYLEEGLRQLLFKSHRFIFQIDKTGKVITVLHVRHTKRLALGEPSDDEAS